MDWTDLEAPFRGPIDWSLLAAPGRRPMDGSAIRHSRHSPSACGPTRRACAPPGSVSAVCPNAECANSPRFGAGGLGAELGDRGFRAPAGPRRSRSRSPGVCCHGWLRCCSAAQFSLPGAADDTTVTARAHVGPLIGLALLEHVAWPNKPNGNHLTGEDHDAVAAEVVITNAQCPLTA